MEAEGGQRGRMEVIWCPARCAIYDDERGLRSGRESMCQKRPQTRDCLPLPRAKSSFSGIERENERFETKKPNAEPDTALAQNDPTYFRIDTKPLNPKPQTLNAKP